MKFVSKIKRCEDEKYMGLNKKAVEEFLAR